ncbi:hypothetical protein [uncultured Sphingomonas sp.]|uniref:hypothetical protein n=1 Tax=uncultured Sphingomonas sp. TaxID=158754 RepID=UPI002603A424|nr:hypothetical protein [uncultured Sphingomonas sp.]
MRSQRRRARLAIVLPVLAGFGLLAGGLWLLPDQLEVRDAQSHAQGAAMSALPTATAQTVPPPAAPTPPAIATEIRTADAARLAALTADLIANGRPVTTLQIAYDLVAAKRPAVALAYLAARPDGVTAETWRLRADLLHKTGRTAEATRLVAAAAQRGGGVAAADLIAAAYAINRPDLVVTAAARGIIPPPDVALALDLARRADQANRPELIAMLDRATRADWRGADPWLAIRVAMASGDTAAALRAADRLPADNDAAREAILARAGDRDGLRRLLLARAAAADAQRPVIAEQLLAAGYREDAKAVLQRAASGGLPTDPIARRLLFLMGPRPAAADLAWLRQQAMEGDAARQRAWLEVYATSDRPAEALAFVARHPLADRTDVMLTRLSLARVAGDGPAARALVTTLLDGRTLDAAQLRTLAASAPAGMIPADALARQRVAAGVAEPRDTLDLAWSAWNAGRAKEAAGWLQDHLQVAPDDLAALRLMADVQSRIGGTAAARPWLERALAQTPPLSRPRAELLDRLGRPAEAIAIVARLRTDAPQDRALAALHARLLIAQGQPGRARTVLAQ